MPELPEVQTIINYLNSKVLNLQILEVKILNNKFIKNIEKENFCKNIIGTKIIKIERIGKYLIFKLSNDFNIVVHLRMEGKFFVDNESSKIKRKHDYIIFNLKNKIFLSYNDSRQFGTFQLTKNLNDLKNIKKIAIDPLNKDFNFLYFKNKINHLKRNIKNILLDQEIVSGIGNIYASEILWLSSISPFKNGNELNDNEIQNIVNNSRIILEKAIKYGGTTIHSFLYANNKKGEFKKLLNVYKKEKLKCKRCDYQIKKIKQNGRSTYYCPNCQK